MSELINTDALAALLSGKEVQRSYKGEWEDLTADDPVDVFFTSESFRLKPRTITINGIEVKPLTKNCPIYENDAVVKIECDSQEEAVKLVAVLRSIFK